MNRGPTAHISDVTTYANDLENNRRHWPSSLGHQFADADACLGGDRSDHG